MRAAHLLAAALLVVVSCQSPPSVTPTPTPTTDPNTFDVSVLADLSGRGASIGALQRQAVEAAAARADATLRLRVSYVDVASDETKLILALKHADDAGADAIVIASGLPYTDLVGAAIAASATPVLFTLPTSEPATRPGGRWAFALAPTLEANARLVVGDADARGLLDSVLIMVDGDVRTPERAALLAELHARNIPLAQLDATGPQAARLARVVSVAAKAVFFAGPPGRLLDAIAAVPRDAPATLYLSYATTRPDLAGLAAVPARLSWPGSRAIVESPVDTVGAVAGDALPLLIAARARSATPVTRERLRLALETLTFSGVATRYTFSPSRHAGFADDDLAVLRWSVTGARVAPPARSAR